MGNSSVSFKSGGFLLLFFLIPIIADPIRNQNPSINGSSTSEHVKTAYDQHIPSKDDNPQLFKEAETGSHVEGLKDSESDHAHHGVHVVAFKFEYVKAELVVCVFIVLIGLFKLVYHQLSFPRNILPESCCLIALGCCIGVFIRWMAGSKSAEAVSFLEFDSKIFFFFLLPPIILEAAYDLNDKAFLDNFGTIILYAVVGTVLNIAIIGSLLIFFGFMGVFGTFGIHALDCLLFASLIAAVDPVAVLAIFKEVGVNKMLYFMVFGESLLNDAVTVVCYNLIQDFQGLETIRLYDCFLGFLAFLCVSFGGLMIGLIFGIFSTLVTKYTNHVRVVEPVICFGMAYLSYVFSELFHFSGIIGIISCGLFQTHYTMANLSGKSYISINYITKVVSSVSESLIFIILGVMLLNENSFFFDDWHPIFAILSLVFCILARFIVVYFLTYIVNRFTGGVRYISFQEQFIMAYGGLRGAVSFSLAFMIDNKANTKPTLLAATYLVIMFTVFIQGSTMKSLVKVMNIRLASKDNNFRLFCEFNKGMVNYMTQGMEDIIGNKNQTIIKKLRHLSRHYLRPILIRGYIEKKTEDKLIRIENEENLKETLKSVPSTSSFKRQQTMNDMVESGNYDLFDEYDDLMSANAKEAQEAEDKEVDELMSDSLHIQALVNNTIYPDRNLIDEEAHERRESLNASRKLMGHRWQVNRIANMKLTEPEVRKRRNIISRTGPKKKVSVNKGLIAIATTSLGVSSHIVQESTIEECDETNSEGIGSPPATARSIKTPHFVFGDLASKADNQELQNQGPNGNFMTAEQTCVDLGGHLASVSDGFLNVFLTENANSIYHRVNATNFWIGGSDLATPGVWSWTDGSSFDYSSWAPGEPNSLPGDNCISSQIVDGTWIGSSCFDSKPYVCNIPALPDHTCPAYCDSEWAYFNESNSCYKTFYNAKWNDAEAACVGDGAHLVSIHSPAENSFVAALARTNLKMSTPHMCWIGLYTNDKNSNWYWTDGSPVDFYNWAPSQPDNAGKENCVELYSDRSEWLSEEKWYEKFQNYNCNNDVRAYVCKKPAHTS